MKRICFLKKTIKVYLHEPHLSFPTLKVAYTKKTNVFYMKTKDGMFSTNIYERWINDR